MKNTKDKAIQIQQKNFYSSRQNTNTFIIEDKTITKNIKMIKSTNTQISYYSSNMVRHNKSQD